MQDAFERAQEEWDTVAEIVPSVQQDNERTGKREVSNEQGEIYKETALVTIEEVLKDFRERYLESLLENEDEAIQLRDGRNRFSRLRTFLQCPANLCHPPLRGALRDEKTEVMATSRCPFDDNNRLHFDILLTLYKQLVHYQEC